MDTTVGLIGAGNISNVILGFDEFRIFKNICIYDINSDNVEKLINKFKKNYSFKVCSSLEEILISSDIIVEVASITAVDEIFKFLKDKKFLKTKVFIILSVGGILKNFNLYKKFKSLGYRIYIPSGAIAGCDALDALRFSKIKHINLITTKPSETLINSDYVLKNQKLYKKMLRSLRCIVYKGNVYEAVKYFPQNINVAATLAVVSEAPQKIKVVIIADKKIKRNIHEIKIVSSIGEIYIKVENIPSPYNPKTSYLAALSTLSTILRVSNLFTLKSR
ncbi:MAG: aspartate dehydrogenase domain-containing protein [Endomicrobiia bacterium]